MKAEDERKMTIDFGMYVFCQIGVGIPDSRNFLNRASCVIHQMNYFYLLAPSFTCWKEDLRAHGQIVVKLPISKIRKEKWPFIHVIHSFMHSFTQTHPIYQRYKYLLHLFLDLFQHQNHTIQHSLLSAETFIVDS